MADNGMEPPPLFDRPDEDDDDDLFASTVQELPRQAAVNGEESVAELPVTSMRQDGFSAAASSGSLLGDSSSPEVHASHGSAQDILNGESVAELSLDNPRPEMETIPISNYPALEEVEEKSGDQFLEISISDPQKVGEGVSAYVAYKVSTYTNMPMFKKTNFSVMRRFSDFLGLHDKLVEKHLKNGRIIPPAPEKSVIGATKIKMSNQPVEQGTGNSYFVERRKASLERYLKRTAAHPVLAVDPDFREFLESDVELKRATNTSALSGAGFKRLFNKVGETVNKITYKMDETDPWFEEKIQHIENLDAQLHKLHGCVEILVNNRRDLSVLTSSVAKSASILSSCEEHNSLCMALSQLADTEEKVESLHMEQANTDFYILCEMLKDYIGLLGAVKDAFHERTKASQHWQHSQQMLTKRRETKAKLECNGRSDKLEQASIEVIEWESKVQRGQEQFDAISKMIKREMERFEENRISDFKAMFVKYLENHLEHQAQLVKYWEEFLPKAQAIA